MAEKSTTNGVRKLNTFSKPEDNSCCLMLSSQCVISGRFHTILLSVVVSFGYVAILSIGSGCHSQDTNKLAMI